LRYFLSYYVEVHHGQDDALLRRMLNARSEKGVLVESAGDLKVSDFQLH